jgi:hypothetical protein
VRIKIVSCSHGDGRLVYEQTNKDRRNSHSGGTPSGYGHRRCALGEPAILKMSSMVMRSVDEKHLGFLEEINEKNIRNNRSIGLELPSISPDPSHIYGAEVYPIESQKRVLNRPKLKSHV